MIKVYCHAQRGRSLSIGNGHTLTQSQVGIFLFVSDHAKLTLESLLAELLLLKDSAEVREVHQGVIPSHHVGEVFPELWVKQLRKHDKQNSPNWL